MSTLPNGLLPRPAGGEGQPASPHRRYRGPDPVESTRLCVQTTPEPAVGPGEEGQVTVYPEAWPTSRQPPLSV